MSRQSNCNLRALAKMRETRLATLAEMRSERRKQARRAPKTTLELFQDYMELAKNVYQSETISLHGLRRLERLENKIIRGLES